MIKTLTFTFAFLFSSIVTQAQNNWISYKIDNKISVKFPSKPTHLSDEVLSSSSKDSSAALFIAVIDLAKIADADSAAVAKIIENPDAIKDLANVMNNNTQYAKLEDFKLGKWNGFTSYTSTAVGTDPRNKYYHVFVFFIGIKAYMFSAVLSPTANSKIKDDYFSSITLN